jgi:dihydroflavonol-4-reductase
MNDTTIVSGGAGFIGSHLVRHLVDSGQQVRVIERPGASVCHLPCAVEVVFADIRDRDHLKTALKGADSVYHLAANPNLWTPDRRDFDAVNHLGTVNVLELALAAGARRVLHTSTESILTKATAPGPIDENVEIDVTDTVGSYCRSKFLAEQFAFGLARSGAPVVVANPTVPVGPGDLGLSPPTRLLLEFCRGKLPALLDCTLNLIDVRDVALGLVRVLNRGVPLRRYLLGNENITLGRLFGLLSDITGIAPPRWRVPYPAALAFAWCSELYADYWSRRMPKATLTGVRLARRLMHFDPSRSLAELGLRPRPLGESLVDAVAWLRHEGLIPAIASGPPCKQTGANATSQC